MALDLGAAFINDVSGGIFDENIINIAAQKNVPYVITHTRGTPKEMTGLNIYNHLVEEVILELKQRIDVALSKGVHKWNILIDPGIGFAKRRSQNIELLQNLDTISKVLPYPMLLGFSNKHFIRKHTVNLINRTNRGNYWRRGNCIW